MRCTVCNRPVAHPARRLVAGVIVEGCVDASHTGHVSGADQRWHDREAAVAIRDANARSL